MGISLFFFVSGLGDAQKIQKILWKYWAGSQPLFVVGCKEVLVGPGSLPSPALLTPIQLAIVSKHTHTPPSLD